jgi:hypothetical protein
MSFKGAITDVAKNGTMFMVARWLSGNAMSDTSWQLSTIFTLIGFATYHYTTKYIDLGLTGLSGNIYDIWVKWSTMFIVSRLLSGGSLTDSKWLMSSLFVLIGFTVYYLFVGSYLQGRDLTYNPKLQNTINDVLMNSTMFIISHVLGGGSVVDQKWMKSSIESLVGFTAYNLGTSHIIDALNI